MLMQKKKKKKKNTFFPHSNLIMLWCINAKYTRILGVVHIFNVQRNLLGLYIGRRHGFILSLITKKKITWQKRMIEYLLDIFHQQIPCKCKTCYTIQKMQNKIKITRNHLVKQPLGILKCFLLGPLMKYVGNNWSVLNIESVKQCKGIKFSSNKI